MNRRRTARKLAALGLALAALPPLARAGNGSNYVHLTNGLDVFFSKTPPQGNLTGAWRCFPKEILHAPTLALYGPQASTYATKISALHLAVTASPGKLLSFPSIALSSSPGTCRFLTSAGGVNFGVTSAAPLGNVVVGPLTGASGPVPVTLLGGIAGFSVPLPSPGLGVVVFLTLQATGTGGTIAVPEGESLVLWIQDDATINVYDQAGPSNRLAVANVAGFDPTATATGTCSNRSPGFVPLPSGGAGGPVLSTAVPTLPRSVGRFDALANALLGNALWVASTNHGTIAGGNNIPYFPSPAANGGSNAGGNVGGFVLPIPPLATLPGVELFLWSLTVDPTSSFLDPASNGGHSLANGYAVLLFP